MDGAAPEKPAGPPFPQQQQVFTCSYANCTKSYTRVEHLARHIVAHENPKAYTCETCGKGFARKDVLVRHQRSHTNNATGSSDRRISALHKVKQACLSCKSAKSRCDGSTPCARCVSLSKECVYTAARGEHTVGSRNSSRSVSVSNLEAADPSFGNEQQPSMMGYIDQDGDQSGMAIDGQDAPNGAMQSVQSTPVFVPTSNPFSQSFSLPTMPNPSTSLESNNDRQFGSITPTGPLQQNFDSSMQISKANEVSANGQASQIFSTQALLAGFDFNGLLYGQPVQGDSPASHPTSEPSALTFDFNAVMPGNDDYLSSFLQSAQHVSPGAPTPAPNFGNIWPDAVNWAKTPIDTSAATGAPSGTSHFQALLNNGTTLQDKTTQDLQHVQPAQNTPSNTSSGQQDLHATDALLSLAHDMRADGLSPNSRPVPPINHGLRTRAPSPALPAENSEWPTAWDARQSHQEKQDDIDVGEVPLDQTEATVNLASMEEPGRLAILELLRFAEFKMETYHRLYVRFARISVATLDHFLRLYFKHVHPYIPWCHLSTLEPSKTSGFLLAAMVAVGAQYSDVEGAKPYSNVLGDIVQRAVGEVVTNNNSLNRDLQLWQALMLWSFFKGSGVRRLTELTDVFRNSYTVAFDRMNVFNNRIPMPADVTNPAMPLQRRWQLWKTWEGRKRTGFSCFLADAEFTIFLNRPGLVVSRELKAPLPCADAIWEAKTEHEWAQALISQPEYGASKPSACDILDFRTQAPTLLSRAHQSSFASCVLVQLLHLSIWNLKQAGVFAPHLLRTAHMDIKRALVAVGGGANEFVVRHPASDSSGWTAFAVLYHQAFVSLRISSGSLLALAGRSTMEEADSSRQEIIRWMQANPLASREVALHAGQCLRIIRESPHESTVEMFSLFFAALVLYVFCIAIQEEAFGVVDPEESEVISLDCASPSAVDQGWTQSENIACTVANVKLSAATAKIDILLHAVSIYKKRKSWGLGMGYARVLQSMAERERLFEASRSGNFL